MKKIFVIILHFGEIEITKECIASLGKSEKYPYTLVVVNNTQKILQAKDFFVKNCVVINNKENKGFSGGVNKGISYALSKDADAILLLNNDTRVQRPILPSLVALLFSGEGIGIIGPAIKFVKKRKKVFDIGGSMTWFGKTYHTEIASQKNIYPHEVRYITGAAMLIKKEVFEKIGLFDKRFFLYYEDVDFCLRARERGFSTWVDTEVSIYHLLSKTAGKASPLSVYHQTRSAVLFGKKYINNPLRKISFASFLFLQTILITLKNPTSGIAGWKGLFSTLPMLQ